MMKKRGKRLLAMLLASAMVLSSGVYAGGTSVDDETALALTQESAVSEALVTAQDEQPEALVEADAAAAVVTAADEAAMQAGDAVVETQAQASSDEQAAAVQTAEDDDHADADVDTDLGDAMSGDVLIDEDAAQDAAVQGTETADEEDASADESAEAGAVETGTAQDIVLEDTADQVDEDLADITTYVEDAGESIDSADLLKDEDAAEIEDETGAADDALEDETGLAEDTVMADGESVSAAITLGTSDSASSNLSTTTSQRFYKITLLGAGHLVINLQISKSGRFYLYDNAALENPIISQTVSKSSSSASYAYGTAARDLTKGDYYLVVSSGTACTYTVSTLYESAGVTSEETAGGSNNDFDSATSFGQTSPANYKAQIAANDTADYYKFNIAQPGRLTVDLTSYAVGLKYRLYAPDKTELASGTISKGSNVDSVAETLSFDLTKGIGYYLVIYQSGSLTGNYTFSFTRTAANETHKDSATSSGSAANNNTMAAASKVSLGEKTIGQLALNDDADYFAVTLDTAGRLTVNLTSYLQAVRYNLYDASGNSLSSDTFSWNSSTQSVSKALTYDLAKGTYYLLFSRTGSGYTGNYYFTAAFVSALESFAETVDTAQKIDTTNNTTASASAVQTDKVYYGQLAVNDDADYYKFTLASSGRVTLDLTSYLQVVRYTLYDVSGTSLSSDTLSWNSSTQSITKALTFDLTKGTYYLLMNKTGSGYTGNYTFKLNFSAAKESFVETNNGVNNTTTAASTIKTDGT